MSMNPFCEIAVEEAVRLKEKGVATEIVASPSVHSRSGAAAYCHWRWVLTAPSWSRPTKSSAAGNRQGCLKAIVDKEQAAGHLGKQASMATTTRPARCWRADRHGQGTFASEVVVENGDKVKVTREDRRRSADC
jgi:hypothetical protein